MNKIILIGLFALMNTFIVAQRFLPTVDTYIEQSNPTVVENTTNPGKLVVRNYSNSERITFLEFNVGDFNEQVSKAELCMYFYAVTNSGTETVDVYEVTSGTISNNITWTNFTGNYTLASTPITSLDISATAITSWCKFDIKNLVNAVSATTGTNKKIKLALKARSTTLLLNFYSADNTTYPFYSPFLVMTPALATNLVEKSRITVNQDGWVTNVNPDNLYDEQRLLIAYYKNGTTKQYKYSNLRFDIPSVLSDNDKVILKTKVKADQSGTYVNYLVDLLGMSNLDDAVNVNNLTWNTMPLTGNYTYLRSKFYSATDKANETVVDWDVTDYVKAQKSAGKAKANFTFQVPELGVAQGDQLAFYSLNYLSVDPASTNIPQLVIYEPNIPTIASFTPSSSGAGTTVTITGTNFTGTTDVSFGGTPATSFTVVNATTITAIIGSGSSGSVSVTTSGGTATKTGFTWLEPVTTISSVQNATALPLSASSVISVTNGGLLNIDSNITVNSITIESGGKVTNSGLLNTQSLVINSDANGTGTFIDNGTTVSNSAIVHQYLTSGRNWYLSIPVSVSSVSSLSTAGSVVRYYEPTASWYTQTIDSVLVPMKGYISANTNAAGTITFTGTLNTGPKSIVLTRTAGVAKTGFNLVGNPYPSYVRWSAATRTNLEPSMWFRSKNSGNTSYIFDTYNAVSHVGTGLNGINVTDTIPPLQAFWVRVSSGNQTGTLSFDNSMRCHRGVNVNKLKAPEFGNDDQKLLRLQVSNGTNRDETILLFNPNAKDEYDIYDSPKMTNANNEVPEIYTQLNNEQLVINGLSKCVENQQYVLGFKTGSRNEFIIKATELKNFESNTNVYLIDNVNNTETEITAGQEYKFVSDPVNSVSRFGLVFRSGSVNTGLINNNREISVFLNQDKNITVLCNDFYKDKASLVLYNLEGNVVNKTDIIASKTILKTTYPTGIYIAKLYTSNKVETFKLVLNN